jgi:hypothetical protein
MISINEILFTLCFVELGLIQINLYFLLRYEPLNLGGWTTK